MVRRVAIRRVAFLMLTAEHGGLVPMPSDMQSPDDAGQHVMWIVPREFNTFFWAHKNGPISLAVRHVLGSRSIWAQLVSGQLVCIIMPNGSYVWQRHIRAAQQIAATMGCELREHPSDSAAFILCKSPLEAAV